MQGTIGGVRRKTIYFTAPRRVELREESLPAPGADEVLVETVCSAISAGTEMLVYRGHFPHFKDADDKFSSELKYPCAFGYACVGRIRETGKQVDQELRDQLVFAFQPHTSAFIAQPSALIFAPDSPTGTMSFPAETCAFLPNMETAVNLIHDAAPILGERVLVIGQGVVGLLAASLLKEFPLETLVTADCFERRRKASLGIGVNESFDPDVLNPRQTSTPLANADSSTKSSTNPPNKDSTNTNRDDLNAPSNPQLAYAQNKFDLTFELSGSPSALNDAIALTAFSGRIVIGSWYGEKRAEIDLGGAFHRSRIKMISSQVSTIAPELRGRWDKARRFGVAWQALRRIQPQKWITHRFPIEEAAQAYKLLDENPQDTIQVVFESKK
jgi:2-desacetyl-2-hydroxyethyl bacteriochlorophyllide A dehydrogenase